MEKTPSGHDSAAESTSRRRFAAYSHDTMGLGHLRRTLSICRHLTDVTPHANALVISGSPFAQALGPDSRIDFLKLPSARKVRNGHYEARFLDLDFPALARLRGAVVDEGIKAFDPDLLLVDKTPAGMGQELIPCLSRLRKSGARTRVVLGLRDILDDPAQVRQEWDQEGLWNLVEELYDEIWIYGQSDFFDTVREYDFPAGVAAMSHFVGYLPKYNGLVAREVIAQELGLDGRRLVVVTAGGGEDGYPLFDHYLRGIEGNEGPADTLHCLVTGPGLQPADLETLRRRADRPGVHFTNFSNHMTSLFAAADLVVTMGGYNSLTEILSLRRPAIVVPRIVPRTEQLIRAERLAAHGLVRVVPPADLEHGALMAAVNEELRLPRHDVASPLRFDGHQGILRRVETLLDGAGRAADREGAILKVVDMPRRRLF